MFHLVDVQGVLDGKSVEVYKLAGGVYLSLQDGLALPYHRRGQRHRTVLGGEEIRQPQKDSCPVGERGERKKGREGERERREKERETGRERERGQRKKGREGKRGERETERRRCSNLLIQI